MSLEPTAARPAPAFTAEEERPITGRPFLVPLYVPHFTARSRARMWSPSPDPRIIAVTALVTLVNSVDKPERPTRGAQVRHSTRPVTEIEPVVDPDPSPVSSSCRDAAYWPERIFIPVGVYELGGITFHPLCLFRP